MDSNIVATVGTGVTAATDSFCTIEPRTAWSNSYTTQHNTIPITCTFKNFYISYATAAGGGLARTFTLQKNNVDTAISVTITDPATSGNDLVNQVSFAPGDTVSVRTSATGTTTSTGVAKFTFAINAAANTSLVMACTTAGGVSASATNYVPIQGNIAAPATTTAVEQVMPTNGTFKNAYLTWNATVGASPKKFTITLYKNGSPTAITFDSSGTTGNDTTHSVSVAAGDRFYWEFVPSGSPTGRVPAISLEFDPTVNGESVRLQSSPNTPSTSAANFYGMDAQDVSFITTEANRSGLTQACVFRSLYTYLQVAPGGTASYQVQTVVNTTAGNPAATVTGAAQGNSDTTNTVTATAGQTASFKITPANTPATTNIAIGVVSFIQPIGGGLLLRGVG